MAIPITPKRTLAIRSVKTITLPDSFLRCDSRACRILMPSLSVGLLHERRRTCAPHAAGSGVTQGCQTAAELHPVHYELGIRGGSRGPSLPFQLLGLHIQRALETESSSTREEVDGAARR